MRTRRSWSATARGDCRGQRPLGGLYPVLGPPPCPAQADPAGPAVRKDPLVVTMKPGDTYILEGERVLTATSPQVHKASGGVEQAVEPASPLARSAPSDPAPPMWSEQALETQPAHCPEHAHPTPGTAGAPGVTHSGHVAPTGGAPEWGAGPSWGGPH